MELDGHFVEWAGRILSDPSERARRYRAAKWMEIAGSVGALVCGVVAVWGLTSDTMVLDALSSTAVGSLGVLGFAACMVCAAGSGIERRFIAFASHLKQED